MRLELKKSKRQAEPLEAGVVVSLAIAVTAMFSMATYLLLAIATFLDYRAFKYSKEQYPPLYGAWSKSWHCNKCYTVYST